MSFPSASSTDRGRSSFSRSPMSDAIQWRKGELIGVGAFGSVYMGMNLDSGELLAVKQVLIGAKNVARQKSQANLRELEEEIKLLQNLSHPHIVRYLGTAREDGALNIFLEFVSGGSIASLLEKFGSFPEPVIRNYTRQLLQGLEYLHQNGIMHRDIKGANILVDNEGCIKLTDFGASKQVVELVTISGAKSMKGTPYWMAPEVIRQTGHSLPADIWSVGCTIIEMATGQPPWSEQFQEVAALFHIGTTKSHPPIPDHLSQEAQDFLRMCLKKEPHLRPSASGLLQHPFIRADHASLVSGPLQSVCKQEIQRTRCSQGFRHCKKRQILSDPSEQPAIKRCASVIQNVSTDQLNSLRFQPVNQGLFSDLADGNCSVRLDLNSLSMRNSKSICLQSPILSVGWDRQCIQSGTMASSGFNLEQEFADVDDGWCNVASPELEENKRGENIFVPVQETPSCKDSEFSFECHAAGDHNNNNDNDDTEEEVTESKIRAFLDEKVLELKRLQTPLYMEFHNIGNVERRPHMEQKEKRTTHHLQENWLSEVDLHDTYFPIESSMTSHGSGWSSNQKGSSSALSTVCSHESEATVSSESPRLNELRRLLLETQSPSHGPSFLSSVDRQRLWKEELQQELNLRREERKLLSELSGSNRPSSAKKRSLHKDRLLMRSSSGKKSLPTQNPFLNNPMISNDYTSCLSAT